jgi:hypothetical protein
MSVSNPDESLSLLTENMSVFDPSVMDGFDICFNNEVPVSFRTESTAEARAIRVRVLERNSDSGLDEVRLEITDDENISSYLVCSVSSAAYPDLAKANGLKAEFKDFSSSITSLLTRSVEKPAEYQLQFVPGEDDSGQLVFLQKLRLRSVTIFTLAFGQAAPDFVRKQVQFRFNALKVELQRKSKDYDNQMSRLDAKNPSLAKQMRQSVESAVQKKLNGVQEKVPPSKR